MFSEIWNCLHWPFCPGVFIAILAFVAGAVAFRVEKASRIEKAIWTFVFLMLVVAEIWMMGIDRANHDKEQADARTEQLRKFNEIAGGINANIAADQQHFDATMSSMKRLVGTANKSLAQVTGNGQFCYLTPTGMPVSVGNKTMFRLAKMNSGSLPLEVCHILVHENLQIKSEADAERAFQVLYDRQLGPLPPGKIAGVQGLLGFATDIIVPEGSYYIQINTRNDRFYETLTVGKAVGKRLEILNARGKIVYPEPSKPRNDLRIIQ
ncbi:MAG: hypothetical protein WA555_00575 [Candidatus Sulfotelmatobacter sp.]